MLLLAYDNVLKALFYTFDRALLCLGVLTLIRFSEGSSYTRGTGTVHAL